MSRIEPAVNAGRSRWSQHIVALAAIAVVALFHLNTIRDGHGWGDDFAQYIMHARNLATGQSYAPTGYMVNPSYEALGPVAYPPVTPAILAPVYARYGLSLRPMKIVLVGSIAVALAGIYLLFQSQLSPSLAALLILGIGLNPLLSRMKDGITSDLPFLAIGFVVLAASQWTLQPGRSRGASLVLGALLGIGMYLGIGARSVGVVVVGAVLLYAVVVARRRDAVLAASVAAVIALTLMAIQRTLLPFEGAYLSWFLETFTWSAPFRYVRAYAGEFRAVVANGYSGLASTVVFFGLFALAVVGAAASLWRGVRLADVFLMLYGGMLLLFEATQRYALPIMPILFFYAVYGVGTIRAWLPKTWAWAPLTLTAAVLAASYAGAYSRLGFRPIEDGATQPAFMELCAFIRTNTPPDARFIFRKPRALALFAERNTAAYEPQTNAARLEALAKTVGASYLVAAHLDDPEFEIERTTVAPVIAAYPDRFEKIWENARFTLYRMR